MDCQSWFLAASKAAVNVHCVISLLRFVSQNLATTTEKVCIYASSQASYSLAGRGLKKIAGAVLSVVDGSIIRKDFMPCERKEYMERGFILPAFDYYHASVIPKTLCPVFQIVKNSVIHKRIEE
jgi:hypothetical protein